MRLVGTALLLALLGASALADDAKPADAKPAEPHAKVPLRVVRMLPEAHQALLFDRTKGTYVVVEAGQTVEGLTVDTIEDDEVTLLSDGGAVVVLAAPAPGHHRRTGDAEDDAPAKAATAAPAKAPAAATATAAAASAATAAAASAATAEPQPADPYAAKPGEPQPSDPYADPIEVSDAPTALGTGKDGVRVVEAPGAPAPVAAPIVTKTSANGSDDAAVLAAIMTGSSAPTAPAAVPADRPTVLARADLSAALDNFSALSSSIHAGFTAGGLRVDSVAAGSLFAKAGLRAGDVVASVDGHPLHSLDDAAELYARAPSAKAMTASVVRGGKPVTLRVSIQ